jgi:hypothetical protein
MNALVYTFRKVGSLLEYLLLEDGGYLLLEDGGKILMVDQRWVDRQQFSG